MGSAEEKMLEISGTKFANHENRVEGTFVNGICEGALATKI